ncbi:hypothetical protein M404DRAFT_993381 [Pisolithus tinctorius Marx 270]|uniref:Uncharacterized protein n=1 Tax=Pisolithus tinctorius Marx 270 TaxID=870435 RepID=A0A0C3PT77_PISTI|nr:hypothetical protein M404DRAFT_993381 [Pisolithus tinctorius Marx 270]
MAVAAAEENDEYASRPECFRVTPPEGYLCSAVIHPRNKCCEHHGNHSTSPTLHWNILHCDP